MILKYFRQKKSAIKLAFIAQNKAKLCNNLITTLVFEKNAKFFAENWPKIFIITSTPDCSLRFEVRRDQRPGLNFTPRGKP
jgi:hypothetical protein